MTIIKEEALKTEESNFVKSASIGFGFFMGIVPIWGFQLLVGIPLAILFRMNKVLFIAAANISIPPMIPSILFVSYLIGGLFVENPVKYSSLSELSLAAIHYNFTQYCIGAIILAFIVSIIGFAISYRLCVLFRS